MKRLIFLGTGGDVETMAKQQRATGGLVLQLNGYQIHIDPGPGSLVRARETGINVRDTIAILASNSSLLRSNDVNALVTAMTLDGLDKHGVLLGSKSVIENPERTSKHTKECVEGLVPLSPGGKVGINNITIRPLKTNGKDPTGLGFLISSDNLLIGYTGDTSHYTSIGADYAGVDVLILNVVHPESVEEVGALNLKEAEELIKEVNPRVAFLTGFGRKLIDLDPMELARSMQRATKVEVTAATDNLVLSLDDFTRRV